MKERRQMTAQKSARKPDKTAKDRAAPKRRRAKRMGLAGRVAMIAVAAAFFAALAQWVVTPFLAQDEIRNQRQIAVDAGANLLADVARLHAEAGHWNEIPALVDALSVGMPEGQSAVFDAEWKLIAQDGAPDSRPSLKAMRELVSTPNGILVVGERYYAARAINVGDQTWGYALYSFIPRPFVNTWLAVVALNAIVLSLVLLLTAPLIYRLARLALKPVTVLERGIRSRDPKDKSKLADSSDDRLLKPLLTSIDEVHERSEAAMRRALTMAYTDPVTRLPNRLRFLSRLDAAVAAGQGAHLVVCDLDRFRQVNLTYGPRVADIGLAGVAERLRAVLSQAGLPGGFIGRIGADQFGMILPGSSREAVVALMSAASSAIAEGFIIEGQAMRLAASFGAAHTPTDATNGTDLLKLAEVALKEAKKQTATRAAFFDQRLLDKARAQSRLEEELRDGLDRGEFVAVFQPKVKLETGELVGAEALAR